MAATLAPIHPNAASRATAPPRVVSHHLTPEVYRRRRMVAALVLAAVILAIASLGRHAGASGAETASSEPVVHYVVAPGDTLWSIAQRVDPGSDPRPIVAELTELAGGALLQPGQRIPIPLGLAGDLAGDLVTAPGS